jgi:toxin FitB
MIILDTNVISEAMQPVPSTRVLQWLTESRISSEVFTTTITMAEILYGVELFPKGKRRDRLKAEAEAVFMVDFRDRILPFDEAAAHAFAEIAAARRAQGRPMAEMHGQIAAIARTHHAALATRNFADFEDCGLRLVNPWG